MRKLGASSGNHAMMFILPFASPWTIVTPKRDSITKTFRCRPYQRRFCDETIVRCSAAAAGVANLRREIESIAGKERGIFGLQEEERSRLEFLITDLESKTTNPRPTASNAEAAHGSWRLLYTTMQILGKKRVQLAISSPRKPGLVKLGSFFQVIDSSKCESKNIIEFKVLTGTSGTFTITAKYDVVSPKRVTVSTVATALEPSSFEAMLGPNMHLLMQIFNPDGYLDITYIDDSFRIGRDNKGHVFVLERVED